mgnify:CR=1 FL=1
MFNDELKNVMECYRKVNVSGLEILRKKKNMIRSVKVHQGTVIIELYPCDNVDVTFVHHVIKEYSSLRMRIPLNRKCLTTLILTKEAFKGKVMLMKERYFISLVKFKRILEEMKCTDHSFEYCFLETSISRREAILCWVFCSLLAIENLFSTLPRRIRKVIKKYKIELKPNIYFGNDVMLGITAKMERAFFLNVSIKRVINELVSNEYLLNFLFDHVSIHIVDVIQSLFISIKPRFII